jgi:hypothetical protein
MQEQKLHSISTDLWHLRHAFKMSGAMVSTRMTALTKAVLLAACLLPLQAQALTPVQCQVGEKPPPSRQEFKQSQMVVMGRVVATAANAEDTDYTFQVERQLKGKRARTFVVTVPNAGLRFAMNEKRRYLLFVTAGKDNKWHVNSCGNSALMARPLKGPVPL